MNDNMQTKASQFMLFFRGTHWDAGLSPEELQKVMAHVLGWFEKLKRDGRLKAGQPLGPQGRIISGGKGRSVLDGPFPESKEAVGGYLLIQAADFDEATAIAKACPTLDYGIAIEVRPVLEECPVFLRAKERLADAAA